ncbi:cyclin-T1-3-like [Silene latifolia]|uniref:cyclin-T1-3-like n=1 Tax=Silene latifolia TaxID=37657 RepID=UPI003D77796F
MSFRRSYKTQGGALCDYGHPVAQGNQDNIYYFQNHDYSGYRHYACDAPKNARNQAYKHDYSSFSNHNASPSSKRRKFSENAWGNEGGFYWQPRESDFAAFNFVNGDNTSVSAIAVPSTSKRDRSFLDDDDFEALMSKEEIERLSPSRKDGIDVLQETRLRYSYCAFIQNLGMRLDVPQTTIGTAMVLCHRFFIRRSHACHDRFLIAAAALFLAAKSEETTRPLNDVVKASCEILHKQDLSVLSYMLPIDWFEQYRERITEAEQLILTTLNFELNVHHPYDPLTSIINKLGLSQTVVVNLALSLVNEGFRSSLWLQFKPNQIAAGVAYLAAKMLNMNLDSYLSVWREFQTPPTVLQEVARQLTELF